MKPFTYREYMYYKIMLERKNYGKNLIKEPETNYEYEDNNINNPHDKIFKEILDNKTEAVKFINEMLKIENTKIKYIIFPPRFLESIRD